MPSILNKLIHKFHTLRTLPFSTWLLFLEALITSAWVKLCLTFFPFNRVMGWLGTQQIESSRLQEEQTLTLRREIKSAVSLCKKYAPWRTECYTMSLTGRLMLSRRKLTSTLYIGFRRDESGAFLGHAWLRANDIYISGYQEAAGFNINFMFS